MPTRERHESQDSLSLLGLHDDGLDSGGIHRAPGSERPGDRGSRDSRVVEAAGSRSRPAGGGSICSQWSLHSFSRGSRALRAALVSGPSVCRRTLPRGLRTARLGQGAGPARARASRGRGRGHRVGDRSVSGGRYPRCRSVGHPDRGVEREARRWQGRNRGCRELCAAARQARHHDRPGQW